MSKSVVRMPSISNVDEVAKTMLEKRISSILLSDDTNKVVGIITERDLLRVLSSSSLGRTMVAKSVMSNPLLTVDKDSSIEDAAKLMVEKGVRHIAVEDVKTKELIGVLSTTDLALYLRNYVPKYYEMVPALFEALYCE